MCKENSIEIFGIFETKTMFDKFKEAANKIGSRNGPYCEIRKMVIVTRYGLDGIKSNGRAPSFAPMNSTYMRDY